MSDNKFTYILQKGHGNLQSHILHLLIHGCGVELADEILEFRTVESRAFWDSQLFSEHIQVSASDHRVIDEQAHQTLKLQQKSGNFYLSNN